LLLECQVNPHLLGKDWNSTNYGGWSHQTLVNMQRSTQFQFNLLVHMGSTFSLVRGWKQLFHMFGLTTCLTVSVNLNSKNTVRMQWIVQAASILLNACRIIIFDF